MVSFSKAGNGPNVLLLHGLFGMGSNLKSVSRALSPYFSVYNVDLPDHGKSSWLSERDISIYAETLIEWLDEYGLNNCHLVGHSLGGKIAMKMALSESLRFDSMLIVDIAPVTYANTQQHIFHAMEKLLEASCTSRKNAQIILGKHLDELEIIQFLSMSLRKNEEGIYKWILNYEGLKRDYPLLCLAPESGGAQYHRPTLFVRGERSNFISRENEFSISKLFPNSKISNVLGAGHWVHYDQSDQFNAIVIKFLSENSDFV